MHETMRAQTAEELSTGICRSKEAMGGEAMGGEAMGGDAMGGDEYSQSQHVYASSCPCTRRSPKSTAGIARRMQAANVRINEAHTGRPCMLHVACCMLHVACCVLRVACCVLHVACCILHVACCMLHVQARSNEDSQSRDRLMHVQT